MKRLSTLPPEDTNAVPFWFRHERLRQSVKHSPKAGTRIQNAQHQYSNGTKNKSTNETHWHKNVARWRQNKEKQLMRSAAKLPPGLELFRCRLQEHHPDTWSKYWRQYPHWTTGQLVLARQGSRSAGVSRLASHHDSFRIGLYPRNTLPFFVSIVQQNNYAINFAHAGQCFALKSMREHWLGCFSDTQHHWWAHWNLSRNNSISFYSSKNNKFP